MEKRWEKHRPPPLPPPRLEREHPSFSAALLDAIYRSIDSSPDHKQTNKSTSPHPCQTDHRPTNTVMAPPAEFWRDPRAATTDHKLSSTHKQYPTTPRYRTASTPSTPRQRTNRPNRVRPDPLGPEPSLKEMKSDLVARNEKEKAKKSKKKKKKSIKSLLKYIFFFKRDHRKGKLTVAFEQIRESPIANQEKARHSSKSFMSFNDKSLGKKRSVRFAPMSVILDDDSKPCGYKPVYDNGVDELIKSLKGKENIKKRSEIGSSSSELFEFRAGERPLNFK